MAEKKKGIPAIAVIGGAAVLAGGAIIYLATRKGEAVPPIPPTDISLSDLAVNPLEVNPGQEVAISVVATNTGGQKGSYKVTLGGDFMAQKTVTLNPGESQVVNFEVTPQEARTYYVSLDGLSGSFVATRARTLQPGEYIVSAAANWFPMAPVAVGDVVEIRPYTHNLLFDEAGIATVQIEINGVPYTKKVLLEPRKGTQVTFEYVPAVAGTYTVITYFILLDGSVRPEAFQFVAVP